MVCIERKRTSARVSFFLLYCFQQTKRKKQPKPSCSFVGVARLERATACTPCKNASQLHHTPIACILSN